MKDKRIDIASMTNPTRSQQQLCDNFFVRKTSPNRFVKKISMDNDEPESREHSSFDETTLGRGSNLRRFGSAAPILTSTPTPTPTSTFESRNNVLERHPIRRPNFLKSPNLPLGSHHTRNVLRIENSDDETEDDSSSVVSKDSNSNENFAFCKMMSCGLVERGE